MNVRVRDVCRSIDERQTGTITTNITCKSLDVQSIADQLGKYAKELLDREYGFSAQIADPIENIEKEDLSQVATKDF